MNPTVHWFFHKETKWQEAYSELRTIVLSCGLTEELKWGCPCYTIEKSNIVLIIQTLYNQSSALSAPLRDTHD